MISQFQQIYAVYAFKHFSALDRRRLWLKLAKLLENNVPLVVAIDELKKRRLERKQHGHPQTLALIAWHKALNRGEQLSMAIEGWVSKEEQMLLAAGENSGSLVQALWSAAKLIIAKKEILAAVANGVTYPFILLLMAFGVLYQFGFKIVPAFVNSSRGFEWQGMAKVMIAMSSFSQNWLGVTAIVMIVGICVFFVTLPHFDGPLRVKLDRFAPYSVYRIMVGSTWLIAMGALMKAGVQSKIALERLDTGSSPWLSRRLRGTLIGINSGRSLGEALLATGFEFPDKEIVDDLTIYASLSGLDETLSNLGDEWLSESVGLIKSQMSVVFGIAIAGVGGLVALMVTGMIVMQIQLATVMQNLSR